MSTATVALNDSRINDPRITPADRTFPAPHRHYLSERSEIRISEKPAPAYVHGIGAELSYHVLRSVRPGAELAKSHSVTRAFPRISSRPTAPSA